MTRRFRVGLPGAASLVFFLLGASVQAQSCGAGGCGASGGGPVSSGCDSCGSGIATCSFSCKESCPPPLKHIFEGPPRIKFKKGCPRPICDPCQLEHFGYYQTCWSPWPYPPDWSHCPTPPAGAVLPPPAIPPFTPRSAPYVGLSPVPTRTGPSMSPSPSPSPSPEPMAPPARKVPELEPPRRLEDK